MKADKVILQLTYSGVIECFAETGNLSLRDALHKFYNSQVYQEMRDGVSDMHCRSEKYLAEELMLEFEQEKNACRRKYSTKMELYSKIVEKTYLMRIDNVRTM